MAKKPRGFTKVKQNEFLDYLRDGLPRGQASDQIGIPRPAIRDYIEETPEFEKLVLDAEIDATELVQEALWQAAISGSVPAAKTWLELKGVGIAKAKQARPPKLREHEGDEVEAPESSQEPVTDPWEQLDNVRVMTPRQRRDGA